MSVLDLDALTPVQEINGRFFKRDDLFGVGGASGGKLRACLNLIEHSPKTRGIIGAGSRQGTTGCVVAAAARAFGLPAEFHTAEAKTSTPELDWITAAGTTIVTHNPGYASVVRARARAAAFNKQYLYVPWGLECAPMVQRTADQTVNVPWARVRRIVVAVGGGMTLAGILTGMEWASRDFWRPVVGLQVGSTDTPKRLDEWAPSWWRQVVVLVKSDLKYTTVVPTPPWIGFQLDGVYEAKAARYLEEGDLLWVNGIRPR
jgi:1-aminocyclopropane-1-carboxylate deaminase/D-cysteine desulfhydrase-like pyridoxal-dependent ACC family enzyme